MRASYSFPEKKGVDNLSPWDISEEASDLLSEKPGARGVMVSTLPSDKIGLDVVCRGVDPGGPPANPYEL